MAPSRGDAGNGRGLVPLFALLRCQVPQAVSRLWTKGTAGTEPCVLVKLRRDVVEQQQNPDWVFGDSAVRAVTVAGPRN